MSQHKFASNVVEKCLEFGGPEERQILVTEMLGLTDENEPLQVWLDCFLISWGFLLAVINRTIHIPLEMFFSAIYNQFNTASPYSLIQSRDSCYLLSRFIRQLKNILIYINALSGYDERSICKLCSSESSWNMWWPTAWASALPHQSPSSCFEKIYIWKAYCCTSRKACSCRR